MTNGTRFAWIIDESISRPNAEWDREVLRTNRFIALPSAGSLVAGWTLVVPRRPMLNLSQAEGAERNELELIATQISDLLAQSGKQVFCFEHGSGYAGSLTGCGVDQAHLHIVPLPFDLCEAVLRRDDNTVVWEAQKRESLPLDALPQEGEYVAIWNMTDRRPMIGSVRRPVSQWVRRIIAEELGIGKEWDYRNYPQTVRVRQTIEMLAPLRNATTA